MSDETIEEYIDFGVPQNKVIEERNADNELFEQLDINLDEEETE